jgi:hypothetical protein
MVRKVAGRSRRAGARRQKGSPVVEAARALEYKVVELSHVDEGSLERAVNQAVAAGWTLDGVQFAMRESSKRPAMAFLFFTRPGAPLSPAEQPGEGGAYRAPEAARAHLERLVHGGSPAGPGDAWARLRALADDAGGGDP